MKMMLFGVGAFLVGRENKMTEINTIVLDDGKEYYIVQNVVVDNITYTLFSDIENEKEIRFRKIIVKDDKEYYVGLDTHEELKNVIKALDKKMNS